MLESIIYLLIAICVVALVFYLVIWVLQMIGISLPPMVLRILMVIFALLVILYIAQMFLGGGGGFGGKHLRFSQNSPIVLAA